MKRSLAAARAGRRAPGVIRPSDLQAASLRQTRSDHASELAEDYVEAIADLAAAQGEARVVDLARRLGVTHVTVNRALARLGQAGFVKTQPYRSIFLTDKGRALAAHCQERHEIVVAFLRSIGVSDSVAAMDAEGIEHHVSPETLTAFKREISSKSKVQSSKEAQTPKVK